MRTYDSRLITMIGAEETGALAGETTAYLTPGSGSLAAVTTCAVSVARCCGSLASVSVASLPCSADTMS